MARIVRRVSVGRVSVVGMWDGSRMSNGYKVRNIVSPHRLRQVQAFFDAHIDQKFKPLPVEPSVDNPRFEGEVAAVLEDEVVVAAIHWTADAEDEFMLSQSEQPEASAAMHQEVRLLQNIAVAESHRRRGVGRLLNEHMMARLRSQNIHSVLGVATGDVSDDFFRRLGYHVYEPWTRARVGLLSIHTVVDLPIEGDDVRWFAQAVA